MAGTAHADEENAQGDGPLAVTVDECTVTVTAAEMPVHISSGLRTAGLAVRVDGEVTATEPVPTDEATGVVTESITVGPLTSDTTVEYRWFGGPVREHDWPAWDTASHPDWVDVVEAREADKGAPWDASDTAEFVTWHSVEFVAGEQCLPPADDSDPTPTPTTEPTAEPTDDPGAGAGGSDDDTLPVTSGLVVPVVLGGVGLAAVAVGGVALAVGRRRGLPLD